MAKRGPNPDAGKRVVLKRVTAVEVAADDPRQEEKVEAWAVVEIVDEPNERKSIEAVAGKPNTPDAKPGVWKSVPLTNWKGQATYERPPEPLVGASWSDD